MERRPAKNATIFIFIFLRFFGRAHPEAGSNREYVVILACAGAIIIAMLMLLQLMQLGATTGMVLVPGCGGTGGGGCVWRGAYPDGTRCQLSWEILELQVKTS